VCEAGSALVCEDGDVCTDDSCDPQSGCINEPILECEVTPVPVPIFPAGGAIALALLAAALLTFGVSASRGRGSLAR
jgi:hypothetical protein